MLFYNHNFLSVTKERIYHCPDINIHYISSKTVFHGTIQKTNTLLFLVFLLALANQFYFLIIAALFAENVIINTAHNNS